MKQHLEWLGYEVRDTVTGFAGVVSSIGFDLFGCVQAIVTPKATSDKDKTQKLEDSRWFDVKRLVKTSKKPVMAQPSFDVVPGGFSKPSYPSNPTR